MCCLLSGCGKAVCSGCEGAGVHAKNWPKVSYVVIDYVWMLLAFIMVYAIRPVSKKYQLCTGLTDADSPEECFGISTIMRMSFTLFVYHLLCLLFILPRLQCSKWCHDGWWPLKTILVIALFFGSHYIPVGFYVYGWVQVCRFGTIIFMLVQTYFLLDLGYKWSEHLLSSDKEVEWARCVMLGYSLLLCAVNVTVMVLLYIKFSPCSFGKIVLIPSTVMLFFFYVSSYVKLCNVHVFRQNWNPFSAATGITYIVYLTWTTLSSVPKSEGTGPQCYYEQSTKYNVMLNVFVGALFTGITVMSLATNARTEKPTGSQVEVNKTSYLGDAIAEKVDDKEAQPAEETDDKNFGLFPITWSTVIFQVILMFCSLYFGMLFSNWGDAVDMEGLSATSFEHKYYAPYFSMWVKFLNLILACVLLALSMMLEVCCPSRML